MGITDVQFYIPLHREDLRKAQHQQQYVVEEVYSEKQVVSLLDGLKEKVRRAGAESIFHDFDVLYSVLHHFEVLKPETKELSWSCTVKIIRKLSEQLTVVLNNNNQRLETDVRVRHLNMTKMSVYILCQLIDCFEFEVTKPSGVAVTEKGRRKNKKTANDAWWESNREEGLSALSLLTNQPLNRLWEPPSMEEEFINLISNCCFKMLENPSSVKSRATKDGIMNLLGFSSSKFGHTLGLSLKVIQMLQNYEHLATPLAEVVEFLVREHAHKNIVLEIIRETGRIESKELARDSVGTRALSQFLVELSTRIPSVVLPLVSMLLPFLDGEAYTMRNCVLCVLGEIVLRSLSCENMETKSRHVREQLLDRLEDHIHDANAFVRSRSLQIWCNLCKEKVIPLSRQHQLLRLVTGRLYDKSNQVRKNSIHFLTAFLQGNPFTAKLSLKELQESYTKEKEKLDKLLEESEASHQSQLANGEDPMAVKWQAVELMVKKALEEYEDREPNSPLLSKDSNFSDVLKCVRDLLEKEDFSRAVQMVYEAKDLFEEEDIFDESEEDEEPVGEENGGNDLDMLVVLKRIFTGWSLPELEKTILENPMDSAGSENTNCVVNEVSKQQVLVQYLKDCVQFAEQIQESIPAVAHLLSSKTTSDILEAINFFVVAYEFGVRESLLGVRKMLLLVWSREASIKEAVVDAYKRLYLSRNDRSGAEAVAMGLIHLLCGLSLGELASLEELIVEFVRTGVLSKSVFNVWWDLFSLKDEKTTPLECHSSLVLLGMAGKAENDILLKNLDVLIMSGLSSPKSETDLLFVKDVCLALLKVPGSSIPSVESSTPPYRLSTDHPLFERLSEIILNGFTQVDNPYWTPMVQQSVKVVYKLAEHPDRIAEMIISDLLEKVQTLISDSDVEGSASTCLRRLYSLVGEVAQAQLVHLDLSLYTELKRRQYQKEVKKQKKEKAIRRGRRSALGVDVHSKTPAAESDNNIDIEMGLVGAEADDNEAEFITKVCETELLREGGLLSTLCPLLVDICSHPSRYTDKKLCISASLTLGKLMMISSSFCEQQLPLLVTILEKSQDPVIRGNTIIALGDLSIRFPNLVEPWTPQLYAPLRDSSEIVRKNTLLVLTHLILNDLIKVKSQISEVALCIVDKDDKVKKMVKTLFNELSKKGNAVYNILPDIISRLSDPECGTEENNFRTVLKFLLSFIDKDRQLECLVEKICIRFNSTRTERQDRDLAYCLSLIPCNERCIRKLHENVACFAEKLKDASVYESFVSLVNGARKGVNVKPELKAAVDELEKMIEELHEKGTSEECVVQKAKQANAARKGAAKTNAKSTRKRKEKYVDSSSSSEEEMQRPRRATTNRTERCKSTVTTPPKRRDIKRSKVPALVLSDSEDDMPLVNGKSDIENEEPVHTTRRSCRKK